MKLLAIDGNSIANRAYYGIKLLSTKSGFNTNAIYGFLTILNRFENAYKPEAVAVAFDVHQPTFRHEIYKDYKLGRHEMPEELQEQMPVIKDLLHILGYKTLECPGWEADDILGTLAKSCADSGNICYIATGDRDTLQLVRPGVNVLLAHTKGGIAATDLYDTSAVKEKYGVEPPGMLQIKALQGDTSDNIPGVRGIGEKTAGELIQKYGTVDYIYQHLDEIDIKESVRTKLRGGKDNAYLSLNIGEIRCNAPIDTDIASYVKGKPDTEEAALGFRQLELYSLFDKFGIENIPAPAPAESDEEEEKNELQCVTSTDADYVMKKIEGEDASYLYPDFTDIRSWDIRGFYFPFEGEVIFVPYESENFEELARRYFESEVPKYVYNLKGLYKLAFTVGVNDIKNVKGDLMLSAYLLSATNTSYDVKSLSVEYNVPFVKCQNSLGATENAVSCAAALPGLFEKTEKKLRRTGENELLQNIEMPLSRVLAKMETVGFEVDPTGITAFKKDLTRRINELTKSIFNEVGHEFNLNSPQQLGNVLFEEMGIPYKGKKTKYGYSTKAEVLDELAPQYPVVADVLEYRKLSKLSSTYCDGLIKGIAEDGRVHTVFNQVETRTGRISSLEPNLQNIPIRTDMGREMRRFFTAGEGYLLVDVDYSQIELRVLANLSGDKHMAEAFNSGTDIHTLTASQVFNMPQEMVTPLMRRRAKAVNFGIIYGIGAFSLAKDIGVSQREAQEYIVNYKKFYSGVDSYIRRLVERAEDTGYAETLFHRRRYLPELKSKNFRTRSFGERAAMNTPIQGTAADIIKIAMIRVESRLERENIDARLILQVHDELIVEAKEEEAERVLKIVEEEMQGACSGDVPYATNGVVAKTWYDAH